MEGRLYPNSNVGLIMHIFFPSIKFPPKTREKNGLVSRIIDTLKEKKVE